MSTQYINEPVTTGKVLLRTTAGDIEVELWCKECPKTCKNFIQLCMEGYYDGTIFHRLVKNFILQGGDPSGTGQGGESIYGKPFKDEFHQRLRFTRRGLLGMANAGRDDNGSQFFFTIGSEPARDLDKKHTVFGKITGPTVFNMLKMTECDVDANDRPISIHKITSTEVLTNPFDDIVPRKREKKVKGRKDEEKPRETKKLNLLSFGDEAEEDEADFIAVNKKLSSKGKSAHDVLDDEKLSKQVAVTRDEMGDYEPEEQEDDAGAVDRIRERFMRKRKGNSNPNVDSKPEKDMDLEEMIDLERKRKEKERLEQMASELKKVQKEYVKALRGPKQAQEEQEEETSDVMKEYKETRLKFKSKTKKLLSKRDAQRESQTVVLSERFRQKLEMANKDAILFDKKVENLPARFDLSGEKEENVEAKNESEDSSSSTKQEEKFGIDLDAEDIQGTNWMANPFVAADVVDPNVTRAKDANLREESEDWYALDDPRHPLNKRKRAEI